jgi:hypothetical protein
MILREAHHLTVGVPAHDRQEFLVDSVPEPGNTLIVIPASRQADRRG